MSDRVLPGDVVMFEGTGFFGKNIQVATTTGNEKRSKYSHVGIGDNDGYVIEALSTVKRNRIDKRMKGNRSIVVYRNIGLISEQRNVIRDYAKSQIGRKYGWWKIGLHLGDYWLSKMFRKDMFFFRKLQFSERYPICSWLVAHAYDEIGMRFGINPKYAQPDDIADWILEKDKYNWVKVKEYV